MQLASAWNAGCKAQPLCTQHCLDKDCIPEERATEPCTVSADQSRCDAAAESYPAQVRSTAHGISAAVGKVGSIGVVVWYNYAGTKGKYWIAWPVSFLGAFICWFFIADTTGLDLAEQVEHWLIMLMLPYSSYYVSSHA